MLLFVVDNNAVVTRCMISYKQVSCRYADVQVVILLIVVVMLLLLYKQEPVGNSGTLK